jgi:hypothetical protein
LVEEKSRSRNTLGAGDLMYMYQKHPQKRRTHGKGVQEHTEGRSAPRAGTQIGQEHYQIRNISTTGALSGKENKTDRITLRAGTSTEPRSTVRTGTHIERGKSARAGTQVGQESSQNRNTQAEPLFEQEHT